MVQRSSILRLAAALAVALQLLPACEGPAPDDVESAAAPPDTGALGDTLRSLVVQAYDLTKPDAVDRIMNLYPADGPVVSASAGRITTSRDTLRAQIERFWLWVGQNMQQPRWDWTESHVQVLGGDAAVLSATYAIPHHTPEGRPHVIGGAWTMVFERRNGRWVIVHEHLSDRPSQ